MTSTLTVRHMLSRFINPMLPSRLVLIVMCVCERMCGRADASALTNEPAIITKHQLQLITPPYIFSPLSHLLCQIVVCQSWMCVISSSFLFVFLWVCALWIRHGTSYFSSRTHLTIEVPPPLSWFCEPAPIFLTGGLIKEHLLAYCFRVSVVTERSDRYGSSE